MGRTRDAMGCCTSHAEVFRATITVAPGGVTCEEARDFLTKGSSWKDIQNKPDAAVVVQSDSWDLQLDGTSNGDVFTVHDTELKTDASGNGRERASEGASASSSSSLSMSSCSSMGISNASSMCNSTS